MAIEDHRLDPLERRAVARTTVCLVVGAIDCAFVVSLCNTSPRALPGIALGSPFLLHLERAVLVGAIVAALSTFVLRGWVGNFPLKISTAGVEYLAQSAASETVGHSDLAMDAVARVEAKQLMLAQSLKEDISALEKQLTQQIYSP
jgi:hypothetical protein